MHADVTGAGPDHGTIANRCQYIILHEVDADGAGQGHRPGACATGGNVEHAGFGTGVHPHVASRGGHAGGIDQGGDLTHTVAVVAALALEDESVFAGVDVLVAGVVDGARGIAGVASQIVEGDRRAPRRIAGTGGAEGEVDQALLVLSQHADAVSGGDTGAAGDFRQHAGAQPVEPHRSGAGHAAGARTGDGQVDDPGGPVQVGHVPGGDIR